MDRDHRDTESAEIKFASLRSLCLCGLCAVFGSVCAAIFTIGCDRTKSEPPPTKAFTLVVSGDTDGWITPCGCTSNQSGGLLRRGSYIAGLRAKGAVIYADVGGAVRGSSEYDRVKFEAILAGEKLMGIAAHNVGQAEAVLGGDTLRRCMQVGAPLVSANVRDGSGQSIAEPMRVVIVGGRRIGITGVMSQQFVAPGLRVDEPRGALLAVMHSGKWQYDSLVILAYLPEDELQALAGSLPEADVIVGGPTGQPVPPHRVGPTLVTSATNKGKFLAILESAETGKWTGSTVEMNAEVPDQPMQLDNVRRYLEELGRRDFPPSQSGLVQPLPPGTPADYRIAGSDSCLACHAPAAGVWRHSLHAQAWPTLAAKHFEVDPACQQCHTTGYGLPGGFETRAASMARVSVGCENCHGPSAAHVADPKRHTPFKAADQCMQCHDHENSPKFEYQAFWSRIRHGREG